MRSSPCRSGTGPVVRAQTMTLCGATCAGHQVRTPSNAPKYPCTYAQTCHSHTRTVARGLMTGVHHMPALPTGRWPSLTIYWSVSCGSTTLLDRRGANQCPCTSMRQDQTLQSVNAASIVQSMLTQTVRGSLAWSHRRTTMVHSQSTSTVGRPSARAAKQRDENCDPKACSIISAESSC